MRSEQTAFLPAITRRVGRARPNTIRLWTCHPVSLWAALQREGVLYYDPALGQSCRDWPECMEWMREQTARRVPGYAPARHPWWAWAWKKPDLRGWRGRFTPSEPRYVRIELALEPERVLLSDFNAWHVPLNQGYLAEDGQWNGEEWDAELERHGLDLHPWPLPEPWRSRVGASWERVFDLSPSEDWSREFVQATFEALRLEDVVAVTEFTPRPNKGW